MSHISLTNSALERLEDPGTDPRLLPSGWRRGGNERRLRHYKIALEKAMKTCISSVQRQQLKLLFWEGVSKSEIARIQNRGCSAVTKSLRAGMESRCTWPSTTRLSRNSWRSKDRFYSKGKEKNMESMSHTIAQYEHGSQKLRERLRILSAEIDKARKAGAPTKGLLDRRYLLYTELTDMEYSLGCMKDYARSIDSKQKAV